MRLLGGDRKTKAGQAVDLEPATMYCPQAQRFACTVTSIAQLRPDHRGYFRPICFEFQSPLKIGRGIGKSDQTEY